MLQVEHPVNAATQLPALSPAGREHGQNRHSAECVGVDVWTLEVPTWRGVPRADLRSQGSL